MRTLVKTIHAIAYPLAQAYWKIFRPKTTGVKVFIQHEDRVLFVQNMYGSQSWTLPGGGIKKSETPEDAARREIREETGIVLDNLYDKGTFLYTGEGKHNTIHVFFSKVKSEVVNIDNFEIQDYSWEKINSLTLSRSPIAKKCFEMVGYTL